MNFYDNFMGKDKLINFEIKELFLDGFIKGRVEGLLLRFLKK